MHGRVHGQDGGQDGSHNLPQVQGRACSYDGHGDGHGRGGGGVNLEQILNLHPLKLTPELAILRESLIVERLNETSEVLRQLLEGSNDKRI